MDVVPAPYSWFVTKLTAQLPDASVQDDGLKEPIPVFDVENVTVPVGMFVAFALSLAVTVHVDLLPLCTVDGLHVKVVDVPSIFVGTKVMLPLTRVK